jgi:hypothetical protein
MSMSIERFKLDERIRLSILKYAGNLELVSKECNIDYVYVLKVYNKFKKRQSRDVNIFIGATITSYILMGAEERKAHARELLNEEINKPIEVISLCCNSPISELIWDGEHRAVCKKCEKDCITKMMDKRDKNFILKLLKQLRDDDVVIVDSAEKLGFVNKDGEGSSPLVKQTNYNVILGGKQLSDDDARLLQNAANLDPRTREKLRKELGRQVIDAEIIDEKSEQKKQ